MLEIGPHDVQANPMKQGLYLFGLIITFPFPLKAVEGPSLDYLVKGLNKVTYSEILMESDPPTSEKTLSDGTKILFWDDSKFVYIDGLGNSKRKNKTCYLNSKGVLVRYKWKDGLWSGDSKEDGGESSAKSKVKQGGASSR